MTSTSPSPELSPSQSAAIESFDSGNNVFITGGAGSGKSYLLQYLRRNYGHRGLEIAASTGIAAVNVGGSTIHSWAGIGLANLPVAQIVQNIFTGKMSRVRRRIKNTRILAIDEVSMISSDVLNIIDRVFRAVRENDAPMGGMQILLFGDFLQLPPINRESNSFNFCFDSDAWKDLGLKTFILEDIFRQSDKKLIKVLNNLRFGDLDEEDREVLESRINAKDDNLAIRPSILTTHNYKVEKINQEALKGIPSKEEAFEGEYFGVPEKIEFLKRNCMAAPLLRLKIGAQVMMTKNTYQKEGIINGSLGIIKAFSPKKSYPLVEFSNGKIITIAPEEWLVERYDELKKMVVTDAGVKQIPLILAWAMTIHKSQGLTLDKISCDLSSVFTPGQAYVALSRARSLEGIFLQSINFNKITASNEAVNFYRSLR